MSEPVVQIDQQGSVRVIRLNRPERKNALTDELGWAIVDAVDAAARDDDVRVVALTGNGDGFCSGLDLGPRSDQPVAVPLSEQERVVDDLSWISRFPLSMRVRCEKPVIAGVNGAAVGAGFSLAMAADLRVASDRARFLAGYARVGTSPDGGLTWSLPQAIGYERALRVLLEPEWIPADEALAMGLVGDVVAAADFADHFMAYCDW